MPLEAWIALIATFQVIALAVIGLITVVVKEYFDRERARMAAEASRVRAEVVKTALDENTALTVAKADRMDAKLETVINATNGLASALGDARQATGHSEGVAEGLEQGRQERRDK